MPPSAESAHAAKEPAAPLALVDDLPPLPELPQSRRLGGVPRFRADQASQAPEEVPVGGPGALELERPGVRRFVPERVLSLGKREVSGDRDRVRGPVANVASRQLAPREAHARGPEAEARGEPVIEGLELLLIA